jgi:hypothetical protein
MDRTPPLTEPEIVQCLYVTGIGIEIADSVVRFVGWVSLPTLGGEMDERRIVMRCAMSNTQARNFSAVLKKGLTRGGN